MKKLLLLTVTVLFSTATFAQDDQAAMQAWMEYASPGEVHKLLASYNGTWNEEITHYMPGAPEPMKQQSVMESKMIMDGRYQKSVHEGDFMGMPFRGESITGYDNARQVFVNTWIDNMGTGVMYSEGKWDARTRTIEYKGTMTDPMTKTAVDVRQVHTLTDENTQSMVMYGSHDGKEVKMMEIKFSRADK